MTDGNGSEDYEEEWRDLDGKVLLAQILAELQQIRLLLSDADHNDAESDDGDAAEYRCELCDTVVPADDRERHARERHRAPPGAGTNSEVFTEVDE